MQEVCWGLSLTWLGRVSNSFSSGLSRETKNITFVQTSDPITSTMRWWSRVKFVLAVAGL